MVNIRSFRLSDYASLTTLLSKVLTEDCYEETMSALMRQLTLDSDLVLVAEKQNEMLGVIIGTIDNNEGYYYRIAVDVNHQRRGIGKRLVQTLQKRFENRKVRRVLISIDQHNERVVPLYEAMGYNSNDFLRKPSNLRIVVG